MDKTKEAFNKVKEDIIFLEEEISFLRESLIEIKEEIRLFNLKMKENMLEKTPTTQQITSTHPTHLSTHDFSFKPLKDQISLVSNGNQGVPTDKQTNRQTDRLRQNSQKSVEIKDIIEILDSLDNVKKGIRLKFKRLTQQEFLVFSTIYQLDGTVEVNYRILSKKLGLSESSIRDYVGRLIKKGVPLDKIKLNNKNIKLSIPEDLKKIASLSTIMQLREL